MNNIKGFQEFILENRKLLSTNFVEDLLDWIYWEDEFPELIEKGNRLLESTPEIFIWNGDVWRFRVGDMDTPDDQKWPGVKSFSKSLSGLTTVINAFNYGGPQNVWEGMTIFKDNVRGLDVTKVIKHLGKALNSENYPNYSNASTDKYYWMACEEIIAPYNRPKKAGTAKLVDDWDGRVEFNIEGKRIVRNAK